MRIKKNHKVFFIISISVKTKLITIQSNIMNEAITISV